MKLSYHDQCVQWLKKELGTTAKFEELKNELPAEELHRIEAEVEENLWELEMGGGFGMLRSSDPWEKIRTPLSLIIGMVHN